MKICKFVFSTAKINQKSINNLNEYLSIYEGKKNLYDYQMAFGMLFNKQNLLTDVNDENMAKEKDNKIDNKVIEEILSVNDEENNNISFFNKYSKMLIENSNTESKIDMFLNSLIGSVDIPKNKKRNNDMYEELTKNDDELLKEDVNLYNRYFNIGDISNLKTLENKLLEYGIDLNLDLVNSSINLKEKISFTIKSNKKSKNNHIFILLREYFKIVYLQIKISKLNSESQVLEDKNKDILNKVDKSNQKQNNILNKPNIDLSDSSISNLKDSNNVKNNTNNIHNKSKSKDKKEEMNLENIENKSKEFEFESKITKSNLFGNKYIFGNLFLLFHLLNESGINQCQLYLGIFHYEGLVSVKNYKLAYYYFNQSASEYNSLAFYYLYKM